jgi:hypothetical protein
MPQEILDLFGSQYVQMFTTISTVYLLFYVFVKGLRDVLDKTPETDDNAFEKFVTLLGKLAKLFTLGQRPK